MPSLSPVLRLPAMQPIGTIDLPDLLTQLFHEPSWHLHQKHQPAN